MGGFIKGYNEGANITILNAIYNKPKKDLNTGKYGNDSIDIVFKDLDTGEKKVQHIVNPEYTYYMTNEGVPATYNKLFIEKEYVHPVSCKYTDLKKDIAKRVNRLDDFYDNIRNGNYNANDIFFKEPSVFNADMHIEDYYRYKFDCCYKNEHYNPSKLYFDIEVDTIDMKGDFPEPGECPVNAVTLIDEDGKTVYTLLLENYNNKLIDEFKKEKNVLGQVKEFVKEAVGGYKNEYRFGLHEFNYKILLFDEEINLIGTLFSIINTLKPDFAIAWNIAFDITYLIERIKVLNYDVTSIICHPDFKEKTCYYYVDERSDKFEERTDYSQISSYTVYIDQLITFASIRKGQRAIASMKLDYVGEKIAGVHKLDYSHITTNISKLPYLDYKTFVFYNIMDVIVQYCIECKVNDIDFVFSKALTTNTRYAKVHRQTTYLVNRGVRDFRKMGYILGNNVNKGNKKEGFAGAFVADPTLVSEKPRKVVCGNPTLLCDNLDDFDYKALYPSIIAENNIAPNTQYGKVFFPKKLDPNENRFNNEYFDRSVWFMEDYVCRDRLNFCSRYLNLATYMEMYYDILKYFTEIKAPSKGLYNINCITGLRNMCNKVPTGGLRNMVIKIDDNSHGRIMVRTLDRMEKK